MASLSKIVVRTAVVGVLGVGALVLIAGPDRVSALFGQARDSINRHLDNQITDPTALRAQLRDLESQYPKKIAAVRSDLTEVRGQITQLKRERDVSARVIDLAEADLNTLRNLVQRAEEARVVNASFSDAQQNRRVEIVFHDKPLSIEDAYAKATEANNTRAAYASRSADIDRDLGYLTTQETRLTSMLTKLEAERQEFQVQTWQLDRQVDSIARNDRMIDMLGKRQASIDEHSRYRAASLDSIQGRIADIRAKQEGELAGLSRLESGTDYENRAKMAIDREASKDSFRNAALKAAKKDDVIRINVRPGDDKAPPAPPAEAGPAPMPGNPADPKPGTTADMTKPADKKAA